MPAQVVTFSTYPSRNPKPQRVYCDSNFLLRLLFYSDNVNQPSVLTSVERDCYLFLHELQKDGCELVTSIYGYSEVMHIYFFWYSNDGMYNVVKAFFQRHNIRLSNASIHDKYKYFVRNYPVDFDAAFNRIAHRIDKVDSFLSKIGIKVLYPLPSPKLTNISKSVVEYASILLDAFPSLEANDAMHLAIADYLNISEIVSLDDAFKDVDDFTVFSRN